MAVAGGLVTPLAFAPTYWLPFAIVGPALGLWAASTSATVPRGAALGWLYGLAFAFPAFRWMLEVDPIAGTVLPLVQAPFFALPGAVAAAMGRTRSAWAVPAVAGAWTLSEFARARVPLTGFEWGQLALGAAETPLRSASAMVGALGLTALLAAVAASVAWLVRHRRAWDQQSRQGYARALGAVAVALGLLLGLSALGTLGWTAPDGTIDVAVVQVDDPCPDQFAADCPGYINQLVASYVEGTLQLDGQPDLVVWGEDALPGGADLDAAGAALVAGGADLPAPLLAGTGTPTGPGQFLRWAALYDVDGASLDGYAKRMPVPFGEYVPWRSVLGGISDVGRLVPSDLQPGQDTSPVVLTTNTTTASIGTVVSWEVTFSRAVRTVATDANGLATLTTVASYGTSAASDQLLDAAQLRAAEHRKPMVVASTTGRSAFIDADGRQVATSALFAADRLTGTMQLRTGLTPYARFGDLPVLLVTALILAAGLSAARPTSHGPSPTDAEDQPSSPWSSNPVAR